MMTIQERIVIALHCMSNFPETALQFNENYKWYSRLLNVWYKRYYLKH